MTKLYSWNVNGLRACMEKGFREFLEREQPDVLCLQETKMQPHQADFDFPGYDVYWNSAVKKGYSGTAVLTKEKTLSVSYDLGFSRLCRCTQREKAGDRDWGHECSKGRN